MTARPEVHIVMIDPGDAAGMPTFARPVRAFIHIEVAEEFAAKAKERPEDAEFWIPPAAITIETVEID